MTDQINNDRNQSASGLKFTQEKPESNRVWEALGITESRMKELDNEAELSWKSEGTISSTLSAISGFAQTPVELAFLSFAVGMLAGQRKVKLMIMGRISKSMGGAANN